MNLELLDAPSDPVDALRLFRERSVHCPVIVFKKSPTCNISTMAEAAFTRWEATLSGDGSRPRGSVAFIDVLAERPLARGLTAELDIRHESPQVLWFEGGALRWHGSHGAIDEDQLSLLWAETQDPA